MMQNVFFIKYSNYAKFEEKTDLTVIVLKKNKLRIIFF